MVLAPYASRLRSSNMLERTTAAMTVSYAGALQRTAPSQSIALETIHRQQVPVCKESRCSLDERPNREARPEPLGGQDRPTPQLSGHQGGPQKY